MTDDLDIPAGCRVDSAPIDGGVCVLNASVPPGHPDHEVWRTPANGELGDATRRARQTGDQRASAARAFLRLERNRRLEATDWVELPSAATRLAADELAGALEYRQELRDVDVRALVADDPAAAPADVLPDPPPCLLQSIDPAAVDANGSNGNTDAVSSTGEPLVSTDPPAVGS